MVESSLLMNVLYFYLRLFLEWPICAIIFEACANFDGHVRIMMTNCIYLLKSAPFICQSFQNMANVDTMVMWTA